MTPETKRVVLSEILTCSKDTPESPEFKEKKLKNDKAFKKMLSSLGAIKIIDKNKNRFEKLLEF